MTDGHGEQHPRPRSQIPDHFLKELHDQQGRLRSCVQVLESELATTIQRFSSVSQVGNQLLTEFGRLEDRVNDLVHLLVVLKQLHSSLDHAQVVRNIEEIVINIVGSEEYVLLEKDGATGELSVLSSLGLHEQTVGLARAGHGPIGEAIRTGRVFIDEGGTESPPEPGERSLVACIPLVLDEVVQGAIVLFGLLGHKPSLTSLDHEVIDLLTRHAALALRCARLLEREKALSGGAP